MNQMEYFLRNMVGIPRVLIVVLFALETIVVSGLAMEVTVIREEVIDPAIPAFGNGSSPSWNFGSPMIVRQGQDVWFSLSRPVEGVPPYANTIWQIYRWHEGGWEVILESPGPMDREPCPLVRLNAYTLAVFINPKVSFRSFRAENEAILWNSHPHLLAFPSAMEKPETFTLHPVFSGAPVQREHTYRGIAVNPENSEVLVFVQDPDSELYHPSYLDPEGVWHGLSEFTFPIRGLYASLFIRDREAHVVAVSDIVEPVPEWRDAKYEVLQRRHDYAFRHIYYAWSPNVLKEGFGEGLVIDSVVDRPGHMRNLDLLVDADGAAHILYLKKRFQYGFLRDQFFPGEPLEVSISYAQVRDGKVVARHDLIEGNMESEGSDDHDRLEPTWGRLHQLPDGRLIAIVSADRENGRVMWALELDTSGRPGRPIEIPLQQPLGAVFFTNTARGGSPPSNTIDLLEMTWGAEHHEIRYAEVEIR
ncbi:MAG: hypothetical protein DRP71_16465 [Verrucomicrobia bacterium]|nr:MAG: hypothetical protein DRP71_16465 [Verrucomicrobiota bacterium]